MKSTDSTYVQQAQLVLKILPLLRAETDVSLKGGTAINFFHRNLPRLSVDIDLTWLPLQDRASTLKGITQLLERLSRRIGTLTGLTMIPKKQRDGTTATVIIRDASVQIKVEVNTVLRGEVFPGSIRPLCPEGEELFEATAEVQMLSVPDLYGGKICAALDRQHPRDLFDIMLLFENEGITDDIRQAFVVYLVSHSRPMAELLRPNLLDIEPVFTQEFEGMTRRKVRLQELTGARERLIRTIHSDLTDAERAFIISVKERRPAWDRLPMHGVEHLPGIQWKMLNLERMDPAKYTSAVERLKRCLETG